MFPYNRQFPITGAMGVVSKEVKKYKQLFCKLRANLALVVKGRSVTITFVGISAQNIFLAIAACGVGPNTS